MNIIELQKHWDEFAKIDPLWAVIACPDKKGNRWQIDEFFQTGIEEIEEIMGYIDSRGITTIKKKVLDFGCGVGRLSQALACHFDQVYGVDISPTMIALANKYNRYENKCKYFLNGTDDLLLFNDNSFNSIYTNITLQHIEPQYTKNYIKEFLRILKPGGLLIFQLPSQALSARLMQKFCFNHIFPRIEMHYIPKEEVVNLVDEHGGKVVDIVQEHWAGPDWLSFRYCVVKE